MKKIIETERIILRKAEKLDAKDLLPYIQEEKIKEFVSLPNELNKLSEYIEESENNKKTYRRVIVLKENKKIIGSIILRNIIKMHQKVEIGYRIGNAHEGKGYITESLNGINKYIFLKTEFQRIGARIRVDNEATIHNVEKLGFVKEGRARNYNKKGSISYDLFLFSLLKEDYLK
ncbi:MAG: GNAT family protein [Candidatus Absconditabacteria bacterium]